MTKLKLNLQLFLSYQRDVPFFYQVHVYIYADHWLLLSSNERL
jgi:hypothetical protein